MNDKETFNAGLSDFHIVMDSDRLSKLDHFMGLFAIKRRSAFIRFLLEYFSIFLEQVHFLEDELMGEYRLINSDKDIKRMNIHLFIPARLHRGIKLIHQDLNFYSIAQIVRVLIDRFLMIAEEYGEGLFDYIKELQQKWNDVKSKMRKQSRSLKVRQLSGYKGKNRVKIELITVYTKMFSPFAIYLL